jgi:hypothetical protein
MVKFRLISILLLCAVLLLPVSSCNLEPGEEPSFMFINRLNDGDGTGIVRDVPPLEYSIKNPLLLDEGSNYTRWINEGIGTADVRWLDCNTLNETDRQTLFNAFPNVSFNSDTVWPEDLPDRCDPEALLELGKNPGLGVRSLHAEGITGAGVSIAIIDQPLLTSHVECVTLMSRL